VSEQSELAIRLARMKELIDKLEEVCEASGLRSAMLDALRHEMDAARQALKQIK